jgi:hypothetical protein
LTPVDPLKSERDDRKSSIDEGISISVRRISMSFRGLELPRLEGFIARLTRSLTDPRSTVSEERKSVADDDNDQRTQCSNLSRVRIEDYARPFLYLGRCEELDEWADDR